MSFKEKSIWVSLISTVCIFGYYFINVLSLGSMPLEQANIAAVQLLFQAVITTVVVEIILQTVIAICNPSDAQQPSDERDKLYKMRANSVGYSVLILGVILTLGHILLSSFFPEFKGQNAVATFPLLSANILFFSFIISEVARYSSQVFFYRKGA